MAEDTDITFTLTVTDSGSLTDADDITVTVLNQPENDFVTVWETAFANDTITIPVGDSTATYLIDWGDGTVESVSGGQTHRYADAGNHTVRISGDFERIYLAANADNAAKLQSIEQWGSIEWSSMAGAFQSASSVGYSATDTPDLTGVTDMSNMFNSSFFNGNISKWDVSSVTDMSWMFAISDFDQPLNDWDVSSVTNMSNMFQNAASFNQPLTSWNVSQVTDMSKMFANTFVFNQPLNDWNVASVTDMSNMFAGALVFNQPLTNWDVTSVTDMSWMFGISDFNQPLNDWDVSQVSNLAGMFAGSRFNQPLNDWDVSSVTNMSNMFINAAYFNHSLNDWNVSSVIDMSDMFAGASTFEQNLGNWYIVLDATEIDAANTPGIVANITGQNSILSSGVTYGIGTGGDRESFVISDNRLNITEMAAKASYTVNITSSATGEFGTNNHRVYALLAPDFNRAPTANAGANQTVTEGATVSLSGTLSSDPEDGNSLSYSWTHTSGPAITLRGAATATPSFEAPNVGETRDIMITLTVTDSGSLTATDTVTITVEDSPNRAPSVNAGDDRTVTEGATVSLNGTASDDDPEDILSYQWTHNSSLPITLRNSATLNVTFAAPDVSANTAVLFTLNVTDGTEHTADTVTITVNDVPNRAPTANAGANQTVTEGATVSLSGTLSSDPEDGNSLSYSWTHTSGPAITLTNGNTATPSFEAPNVGETRDIMITPHRDGFGLPDRHGHRHHHGRRLSQ